MIANIEMKNLVISSEQSPTKILLRQQTQVDHNKLEANLLLMTVINIVSVWHGTLTLFLNCFRTNLFTAFTGVRGSALFYFQCGIDRWMSLHHLHLHSGQFLPCE